MKPFQMKTCPMCGAKEIRRVKRDIVTTRPDYTFTATAIDIEECPACGERFFSLEAMEAIEAQRPQTARRRRSA